MGLLSTRLRVRFPFGNLCRQAPTFAISARWGLPGDWLPSATRAATRRGVSLCIECLERQFALSKSLDVDGAEGPCYIASNIGATLSLSQFDSRLSTSNISIAFHSADDFSRQLRDCSGENQSLHGLSHAQHSAAAPRDAQGVDSTFPAAPIPIAFSQERGCSPNSIAATVATNHAHTNQFSTFSLAEKLLPRANRFCRLPPNLGVGRII